MATRKGTVFAWTTERQDTFDALKSCLLRAPSIGPVCVGHGLFAVGGVLNHIQDDREVVIAYSLRQSQRQYCTTCWEMLATVTMYNHFRSCLRVAQLALHTDHQSLRLLQKFRNSDGMLVRWYMLQGQFSVTFKYHPGSQHANADDLSRQCGQWLRPRIVWWGHWTLPL